MEFINTFEWRILLEIFGLIGGLATIFGLFLGPMFWLGSKIDSVKMELKKEIENLKSDVYSENKDFHGRLCVIEEKNRGVK